MASCAAGVDFNDWTVVPLDQSKEGGFLMGFSPISTIDVFKGRFSSEAVAARVSMILEVNPWLAGRLATDPVSREVALMVPATPSATAYVVVQHAHNLHVGMSYPDMYEIAVKSGNVRAGFEALDRDLPLFQVTIFRMQADHFALMMSLSHVIADGFTFYAIRSMLSSNVAVASLDRQTLYGSVHDKGRLLQGSEKTDFMEHPAFLASLNKGSWRRKPEMPALKYVSQSWVHEQKGLASGKVVPFVSTNDVLTSWWMNYSRTTWGIMAADWRGRIRQLPSNAAGNYIGLLGYWLDEADTPEKIRQSLATAGDSRLGGSRQQVPTWSQLEAPSYRSCIMSNWSTFYTDVVLEGCDHLTHTPLLELGAGFMCGVFIIFKVNAETLAAYCYRDGETVAGLESEATFAGEVKLGVAPVLEGADT
eukprot:TRINITY_DN7781_c0_g1_i3.p1 TRINITY_DN7781_c0_g1~~TRINITY_DN7781_c0_g1_i3.p1  ORF type:complete len:420 (-),score=42.51 TRINITY_DN7781_c0_g1_i3:539-1798(-)